MLQGGNRLVRGADQGLGRRNSASPPAEPFRANVFCEARATRGSGVHRLESARRTNRRSREVPRLRPLSESPRDCEGDLRRCRASRAEAGSTAGSLRELAGYGAVGRRQFSSGGHGDHSSRDVSVARRRWESSGHRHGRHSGRQPLPDAVPRYRSNSHATRAEYRPARGILAGAAPAARAPGTPRRGPGREDAGRNGVSRDRRPLRPAGPHRCGRARGPSDGRADSVPGSDHRARRL